MNKELWIKWNPIADFANSYYIESIKDDIKCNAGKNNFFSEKWI